MTPLYKGSSRRAMSAEKPHIYKFGEWWVVTYQGLIYRHVGRDYATWYAQEIWRLRPR